ncbi:hypothetical protein ACFL4J_00300 [Candidatus Margulisiibacteriota bacterium]
MAKVDLLDRQFMGTVAFRSEEFTLPDGSKMALGIDDGHWVLIYQGTAHAHFHVYKYDQEESKIYVDQKTGGKEEIKIFKKYLAYFFKHASVEDLVTLIPPKG